MKPPADSHLPELIKAIGSLDLAEIRKHLERLPWALFLYSLLGLFAMDTAAGWIGGAISSRVGDAIAFVVSLLLALASMVVIYYRRFTPSKLGYAVLVALVSSAVLSNQLGEWLDSPRLKPWSGYVGLGAALLLLPLGHQLRKRKEPFEELHLVARDPAERYLAEHPGSPIEALILFLSTPSLVPETEPDTPARFPAVVAEAATSGRPPQSASPEVQLTGHLSSPGDSGGDVAAGCDIVRMKALGRHPWQQMLRSLQPHVRNLRHVLLLGSGSVDGPRMRPGEIENQFSPAGSARYLADAGRFLRPYLGDPARCPVTLVTVSDFEDPEQLIQVIRGELGSTLGRISRSRIALDITSGQKTNSLIGGVMTLDDDLLIQYVPPGDAPRAVIYNLIYPITEGYS